MPNTNLPAGAPEKKQNAADMFLCSYCGKQFTRAEMWEEDQCQMCWESECSESWWRALNEGSL